MKTWVVGDLHGKIDIFNVIIGSTTPDKLVFVGDILDSFDLNVQDQINIMDRVLHEVKHNSNISCILGNHELSYIDNKKYACSGHMFSTQMHMMSRISDVLRYFDRCLLVDDFLITHAGVSDNWLPEHVNRNALDIMAYILGSDLDDLMQIGRSRGGYFPAGGPFWCDFWKEFSLIPNVKQVFGHSAARPLPTKKGVIRIKETYNVDCLDHVHEILEINDGEARIIGL